MGYERSEHYVQDPTIIQTNKMNLLKDIGGASGSRSVDV